MKSHKRQKKKCGTETIINVFIVGNMFQKLVRMHILLKEASGGLGIEENIVTLCPECHYQEDFGQNTELYEDCIENYLKDIYGTSWNKEKLKYNKYN